MQVEKSPFYTFLAHVEKFSTCTYAKISHIILGFYINKTLLFDMHQKAVKWKNCFFYTTKRPSKLSTKCECTVTPIG